MISQRKRLSYQAIIAISSLGISTASLGLQLLNMTAISRLSKKPPAVMMQTSIGQTMPMISVAHHERTPETIRMFTSTMLYRLFTWKQHSKGVSSEDSPWSVLENKKKLPRQTYYATYAVSGDFRKELQEHIASLMPSGVSNGRESVILIIDQVSSPQALKEGQWKLIVKANLNFFKQGKLQKVVPFHREVFVEVVDVPSIPKGDDDDENAIFSMRLAGLQIFHMRDVLADIPR